MALGFAIIGTGRFAATRVAPALARAQGCKLIAVVSRDRDRAAAFAAEHGIPAAFDSLDAALADRRVDAIWVTTPNDRHRADVETAARARRHVLCEKPLATTLDDARAIVAACRRAGVALGTGFHLRHHPLHHEVRRLVAAGALGPVVAAGAEWSLESPASTGAPWRQDMFASGGGIGTGTAIHCIDLLRFVLDDDVTAVSAITDHDTSPIAPVESRLAALLRFRRGTTAVVRAFRPVFRPANSLDLQGPSASLLADGTIDEAARGRLEARGTDVTLSGVPAGTDLYALQAQAFAEAAQRGDEPNASGADGVTATAILLALYTSARTGRETAVESAR